MPTTPGAWSTHAQSTIRGGPRSYERVLIIRVRVVCALVSVTKDYGCQTLLRLTPYRFFVCDRLIDHTRRVPCHLHVPCVVAGGAKVIQFSVLHFLNQLLQWILPHRSEPKGYLTSLRRRRAFGHVNSLPEH